MAGRPGSEPATTLTAVLVSGPTHGTLTLNATIEHSEVILREDGEVQRPMPGRWCARTKSS